MGADCEMISIFFRAFLQRHTDSQPLSQSLREIETLSMTMAAESILYVHQTSPNKSIQRAPDGNAAQDEAMLALELQLTRESLAAERKEKVKTCCEALSLIFPNTCVQDVSH